MHKLEYTYDWFRLMYGRNKHIKKQLSSNYKLKKQVNYNITILWKIQIFHKLSNIFLNKAKLKMKRN